MITIAERDKRREMCSKHVTLNGKPARINGALCAGATVWAIDQPENGIPFSWETVYRIVAKGGRFVV